MKILRILLLSIIFSTVAIGQGLMMKDSVASAAAGKVINKYILPSVPVPVKIYGNLPPLTVSGGATAANQLRADSLQYKKQMIPVRDSMVNVQAKTYDFGGATKAQFSIYNPSGTLIDSIKVSVWNYAKNAYTTNGFAIEGLNYSDNGYTEANNALVLIPVSTTRKFMLAGYGHFLIKIEWVATADKTSGQKFYISYQKIN